MKVQSRWMRALLPLAFGLGACAVDEETLPPPPPAEPTGCPAPSRALDDGTCLAPGVQDDGCAAGTLHEDGMCRGPGVRDCADGFEVDGAGCRPVLPASVCAAGEMAIPGDSACHAVAECPAGAWGDLPVDATTQYVDANFVGASDGTAAQPWTRLEDAVEAAAPGALIALAAGRYDTCGLDILKPLQIAGVCPAQVEIGCDLTGTYSIAAQSPDVAISRLSINGAFFGIVVANGGALSAEHLWVRDAVVGFLVQDDSYLDLRRTLVDACSQGVVLFGGAEAIVSESHFRDLIPLGPNGLTAAVSALDEEGVGRSSARVLRSFIERAGCLYAAGSSLDVVGTVLRDTHVDSPVPNNGQCLAAITAFRGSLDGGDSQIEVQQSVIERPEGAGMRILGSSAVVRDTVIRDAVPAMGLGGEGYVDVLANSTLERVLIEGVSAAGMRAEGSSSTCRSCLVRDVARADDGTAGYGFVAAPFETSSDVGTRLEVVGSHVLRSHDVGILGIGADLVVEGTLVEATGARADGSGGRGVEIQGDLARTIASSLDLRTSRVVDFFEFGVGVFAADATVVDTAVETALEHPDADGFLLVGAEGAVTGTVIDGLLVRDVARAGLAIYGADLDARRWRAQCTGIDALVVPLGGLTASVQLDPTAACGCGELSGCEVSEQAGVPVAPSVDTGIALP